MSGSEICSADKNKKTCGSGIQTEPKTAFPWERGSSRVLRLDLLLFVGAGGWAATAQLTGAIIAPGMVKVDQNLKSIQHRDGGIISEIAVKEGDFVTKGQVMLRLDDAETRAELSIVRTQLVELMAKQARLMAERDNLDAIMMSSELTPGCDPPRCAPVPGYRASRHFNSGDG